MTALVGRQAGTLRAMGEGGQGSFPGWHLGTAALPPPASLRRQAPLAGHWRAHLRGADLQAQAVRAVRLQAALHGGPAAGRLKGRGGLHGIRDAARPRHRALEAQHALPAGRRRRWWQSGGRGSGRSVSGSGRVGPSRAPAGAPGNTGRRCRGCRAVPPPAQPSVTTARVPLRPAPPSAGAPLRVGRRGRARVQQVAEARHIGSGGAAADAQHCAAGVEGVPTGVQAASKAELCHVGSGGAGAVETPDTAAEQAGGQDCRMFRAAKQGVSGLRGSCAGGTAHCTLPAPCGRCASSQGTDRELTRRRGAGGRAQRAGRRARPLARHRAQARGRAAQPRLQRRLAGAACHAAGADALARQLQRRQPGLWDLPGRGRWGCRAMRRGARVGWLAALPRCTCSDTRDLGARAARPAVPAQPPRHAPAWLPPNQDEHPSETGPPTRPHDHPCTSTHPPMHTHPPTSSSASRP